VSGLLREVGDAVGSKKTNSNIINILYLFLHTIFLLNSIIPLDLFFKMILVQVSNQKKINIIPLLKIRAQNCR